MTWPEIIRMALEEIGAVRPGGQVEHLDEISALRKLKALIDTFVLQGFIVPGYERHTFTIAAPVKRSYTLGPGRDIVADTVPIRLRDVSYKGLNWLDWQPLDEINIDTYQHERRAEQTAGRPWSFYYELGANFGTLNLNTYPTVGDQLELVWPRFLLPEGELDRNAEAVVPLGWGRFLYLALAAELTNSYRIDVKTTRDVQTKAAAAEADIVGNLHVAPRTQTDPMFVTQRRSMVSPMRGSLWR